MALLFIFLLLLFPCLSQDTGRLHRPAIASKTNIFNLGVGGQYGFIFAHSEAVENTKGSYPYGAEILLSWQRNDRKSWDLCNCYPRKGLLLAYYNYDNKVLGSGIASAYFLEPSYRLGKHIFFSFKGAAGLAYLTRPQHPDRNPGNLSYSSAVSGYLLAGTGIWIRLHDKWWINPSINYQHISNGGMREPNKGINWPTAGLAINYTPHPMPYFSGKRSTDKYWKSRSFRWDIGLFGMPRRWVQDSSQSKRVLLLGLQLQAARLVGRINALTVGMEITGDRSLYLKLKKDSAEASPIRAGLLGGHEFLLGKFRFNQRLGVYLFDQTPYYDALFHCWGIHFQANKHIGMGLNLKAHRHIAEYIDFRLVYSFE
ncbi:acyloxyacyl hydrolase [Terrimonas alba]|uniref:acyloxyacyl hydrolase n=1 Tax=Terrimonas alba TaxID=3349636 RepID=UPI0035F2E58A